MKRIALFIMSFCLATTVIGAGSIRFRVLFPAPVTLPQHIQRIAIIDRSIPQNKNINILESVITGEGIGQDKMASQITLDGVFGVMQNSERYTVIRTTESLKGSDLGNAFPPPLSWDQINELCKKYDVDAILSLENFDSNFIITSGSKSSEQKDAEGKIISLLTFSANGVATVKLGFRIYDPADKSIVDEYHFDHHMDWSGSGNSVDDAVRAVTGKNEAIRQASYNSGEVYARRITPSWYTVERIYYRRSKHDQDLAEGARMMEINNWDEAITSLDRAVTNGKRKTRGRAAHNMAVVYEILGDLGNAKKWAQDAYAKYRNKKSKYYLYDLNDRINDQQRLNNQLSN